MDIVMTDEEFLMHYGTLRRSGRYPWGSGEDAVARNSRDFLSLIDELRQKGMSDQDIMKSLDMNSTEFRAAKSIATSEKRSADIIMAQRLKEKGLSNIKIGERMGINESSVRSLLAPGAKDRADALQTIATMLKDQVEEKQYVGIGKGSELYVHGGISQTKLKTAVAMLKMEGYRVHYVPIQQLGTGKNTTETVLTKGDVTYSQVMKNKDKIQQIVNFSKDGGRTILGIHPPISIDSKRIDVKYKEDGGDKADGVIYVRPGVKDVSIGANRYAQVRVMVDGTHFLKGMAVYKDDLPPGVDLQFNTNKSNTGNKHDAFKPIKDDPENPFGSIIRQMVDVDEHGNEHVTSAMNIVGTKEGSGVEGAWDKWSHNFSSQFLSKQPKELAKEQLDITYRMKRDQFDEIMQLTNPSVRKKLLIDFADGVDSSAVHLEAHSLPGTANRVLLPINSLKETEIYAPSFRNGQRVALVRHPHGGPFEIPELTVNNKNQEARKILGTDPRMDAVGINHKVAQKLSGADFDGDNVLVIPNDRRRVKSAPPLEKLKNFDPQIYKYPPDTNVPKMKSSTKQKEMGTVSNLITDMSIKGATNDELARAIMHSMVVIDAEKHHLNYKQSAIDNGILELRRKYQGQEGTKRMGAATLLSRATSDLRIPERKEGYRIDPTTGKKIYRETGNLTVDKSGKVVPKLQKVDQLSVYDDARKLMSPNAHPMEIIYANHSNKLKSLANEARLAVVQTKRIPYSPSAKVHYAEEVTSLNAKLNLALRNAPKERQAQIVGNAIYKQMVQANPNRSKEELKKIKAQALVEARRRMDAGKPKIFITDREWEAIQAGAISPTRLDSILNHADIERVKELATPRTTLLMTPAKTARAKRLLANDATLAEVADQLGVSLSTLKASLGGE